MNLNTSDEDNKHDTNYINKHKDTNHDTRKLHLWARHVERAVSVFLVLMLCHTHLVGSSGPWVFTSSHLHTCAALSDLTFLPFYFNLSFPVSFHSSVLMHPEPHTDLDNLNTVQHNLHNSAKGSNDAYDVTVSLTERLNVEQTHERTGRPAATLHTAEKHKTALEYVLLMKVIRSLWWWSTS